MTTYQPKNREELKKLIQQEIQKNGNTCDLNHIDTSLITDMSQLFLHNDFNGNISNWNVSNVTDMSHLFHGSNFNGDISRWNVSKVTNMQQMFDMSQFDGDISMWDVSHVENMDWLFNGSSFSQDLTAWQPLRISTAQYIFVGSPAPVPYWFQPNSIQIKEALYKYKEAQKLSHHLQQALIEQEQHCQLKL